jgi:acyl-CoA oxidase
MENNFKDVINNSLNSVCEETREKFCNIIKNPLYTPIYDISLRNQKELAQKRLKEIAKANLVSVKDFRTNPDNIFTMHELVNTFNIS